MRGRPDLSAAKNQQRNNNPFVDVREKGVIGPPDVCLGVEIEQLPGVWDLNQDYPSPSFLPILHSQRPS